MENDLHAADAQYHRDCLHRFKSNADPSQLEETLDEDPAITMVIMLVDKSRIWNTIELEKYTTAKEDTFYLENFSFNGCLICYHRSSLYCLVPVYQAFRFLETNLQNI